MRIDHEDIQEMRRLERELNALKARYEDLWHDVECERPNAEEARAEMEEVAQKIESVEAELDVVGGFNGE